MNKMLVCSYLDLSIRNDYIKLFKSSNLNYNDNGRIEFLQATLDIKLGRNIRACLSLEESIKNGFNPSVKLAASIKCF